MVIGYSHHDRRGLSRHATSPAQPSSCRHLQRGSSTEDTADLEPGRRSTGSGGAPAGARARPWRCIVADGVGAPGRDDGAHHHRDHGQGGAVGETAVLPGGTIILPIGVGCMVAPPRRGRDRSRHHRYHHRADQGAPTGERVVASAIGDATSLPPISAPARIAAAAAAARLLGLLVGGRLLLLDLAGDRRRERDGHSAS